MSAAVPDPRFRDQLVVWFHGGWCADDHVDGDGDPWCAQQASDLMSLIAAHVEAEVQAAVNQRAAEELQAAATKIMQLWDSPVPAIESAFDAVVILRARAAALASPAPAPRAEATP